MIYIKKNEINPVVLTLTESSNLTSPFYLFEFTPEFNLEPVSIYFTTDDESLAPNRYNLFNIVESSTGSTTGGTSVSLSLMAGQYDYNVYEASASTLSISATTGVIIETGRMVVDDTTGVYTDQVIPNQNNTNTNVYK